MPNILIQLIIIEFFLILTIWRSKHIFKRIKNDEEIKKDLLLKIKQWEGKIEDFIDFKKYEYTQEFWICAFMLTFSIFLTGIFISLQNIFIEAMGLYAFITLLGCSIYFVARFTISAIPNAHKNAKENIKFLLETKSIKTSASSG